MIEVNIPLFSFASFELPIAGQEIDDTDMFRIKGIELLERMHTVAMIVERLRADAWIIVGEVFHLCAFKEGVLTLEDAKEQLRSLGIPLSAVSISECADFEDE